GLFHTAINNDTFLFTELRYTEINSSANDGLGRVELKDQIIFTDTISTRLSAVKHANGRDWWIVQGRHNSNTFHVTL
ncbi:MAG: hypothetical protein AAFZ63_03600, partial [Bacteroidota bacterium]